MPPPRREVEHAMWPSDDERCDRRNLAWAVPKLVRTQSVERVDNPPIRWLGCVLRDLMFGTISFVWRSA